MEDKSFTKLKQVECENRELRSAIKNATIQLEILEEKRLPYCTEPNDFKHNEYLQKIIKLECDRDEQEKLMHDYQAESARKICKLECEKNELQKLLHDYQMESARKMHKLESEKEALEKIMRECQTESAKKIATLESLLLQYQTKTNNSTSNNQNATMRRAVINTASMTDLMATNNKSVGVSVPGMPKSSQTYEEPLEPEAPNLNSNSKTSLKSEESKLEDVVNNIQHSVSKILVSENNTKQDKLRIAELEQQLSNAYSSKESEIEAARACREQEILNLKQLIDTLITNLDNEKQRSQNLQKAVDLYRDTVETMKDSEDTFKQEVMDQKQTIQNLQAALVETKHHLEDVKQKTSVEYEEHSLLVNKLLAIVTNAEREIQQYVEQFEQFSANIEKLRDENVQLEETLFYNHQDLEMYEMRLAKYQNLYNQVEAQCATMKQDLRILEAEKLEKETFVQDLSEHLSGCRQELSDLFNLLNEEKIEKEDQSEQIAALQMELNTVSEKLTNALSSIEYEKQQNANLSKSLNTNQSVINTIRNETILAHKKLQEAAAKIASDEQRIQSYEQQLDEYESELNALQNEQSAMKQQLEKTQVELGKKCCENVQFNEKIDVLKKQFEEDTLECRNTIANLNEKNNTLELNCKQLGQELHESRLKYIELDRTECKFKQVIIDNETKFCTKINKFQSEQERLIAVITSLEKQICQMNVQLMEKDRTLEMLKSNVCGQEKLREKHEEIIRLKNEINTLIQTQALLKSDNEKIQLQLSHMRASLAANDDKQKRIITELEVCLSDLQSDKDFLVRKNEQLVAQLQSLQEICNNKAESVVSLEIELTDTKCHRDTLCNESRQVIDHVKSWLDEQRKINLELNQRLKHKNDIIAKLKEEIRNLLARFKQSASTNNCDCCSSPVDVPSIKHSASTITYPARQHPQYSMQVIHSPPPAQQRPGGHGVWSLGSIDSAPCSLNDESDWEGENSEEPYAQQIWIHRVESLTEDLQRSNHYWKSKMSEKEYSISRDK